MRKLSTGVSSAGVPASTEPSASLPPIQMAMNVGCCASACCTSVPNPRRMNCANAVAVPVTGCLPVSVMTSDTFAPGMLRLLYGRGRFRFSGCPFVVDAGRIVGGK